MKKILVIEDEKDIREAICEVLQDEGYEVLSAVNGESGLQQAFAHQPDLIILDIKMPIMNGLTMLGRLREDQWGSSVKVIVMTAMDDPETITQALEGDLSYYLIKSNSSLQDLTDKIKTVF